MPVACTRLSAARNALQTTLTRSAEPGYCWGTSMKTVAIPSLTLLFLLASACGDGDRANCAIARENLDQCNAELLAAAPFGAVDFRGLPLEVDDDCSGWNACDAKCIEHASCAQMAWAFRGIGSDPDRVRPPDAGVFMQCLMSCYDRFHTS